MKPCLKFLLAVTLGLNLAGCQIGRGPVGVTAVAAADLATALQQRRELLPRIQLLSAQNADLLRQLRGLLGATVPEERALRQQLQAEQQAISTELQRREAQLGQLNDRIETLQQQSAADAGGALQDQLLQLNAQVKSLSADIAARLTQRESLRAEIAVRLQAGDSQALSALQGELEGLDQQLADLLDSLQLLSLQLQRLDAKLSSQTAALPASQRQARLADELAQLKAGISRLEAGLPGLKARIEALAGSTDQLQIERRESLEAEYRQKSEDLARARQLEAELQTELDGLAS